MTGFKKNFEGIFCKKNSQKTVIFVFISLVLSGISFSNKLPAQSLSGSMNLVGSGGVFCEATPANINFSATGTTPPFTFSYTISDINGTIPYSVTTSTHDTTIIQADTGTYTYSLSTITDGTNTTVPGSGSLSFIVHATPKATITVDKPEVCQFDSPLPNVLFYASDGTLPYTMLYTQKGVSRSQRQNNTDTVHVAVSTSDADSVVFALLSVQDGSGCYASISNDTATVKVDQHPFARFSVTPTSVSNLAPTVLINDVSIVSSTSTNNYTWDFGDSTISYFPGSSTHTYKDTGTYTIKLQITTNTNKGVTCNDHASQTVKVFLPFTLYVPSAFSPNNDGVNDIFTPKGDGIKSKEYDMTIYDRWGNKVFYTNDINKGWDGRVNGSSTIVPIDSYVYVINLVTDEDNKTYIFYGSVTSTLR